MSLLTAFGYFSKYKTWNEFFDGSPSVKNNQNARITLNGKGVIHISNSNFQSLSGSESGGCIYWINADTYSKLLIEDTTFYKCSASTSAGAFYFKGQGSFAMNRVCGSDINSNTISFGYSSVYFNANNKNDVKLSSVVRCTSTGDQIFQLDQGYATITLLNSSHNTANRKSSFTVTNIKSGGKTMSIKQCSFARNEAKTDTCIYIQNADSVTLIENCNIIHNKNGYPTLGVLIDTLYPITFQHSCIMGNKAFSAIKIPIRGRITIIDSTIDFTTANIDVKNPPQKNFINEFDCLSNDKCFAQKDTADGVTPAPTPFSSPFKTPCKTPFSSPFKTPYKTPFSSPFKSPYKTPFSSPLRTPEPTQQQNPCTCPVIFRRKPLNIFEGMELIFA